MAYLDFLESEEKLIVSQKKELLEILSGWETKNRYELMDIHGITRAMIMERSGDWLTWLTRLCLRSHRPLKIDVTDGQNSKQNSRLMFLSRKFFFFFSNLIIRDEKGRLFGCVKRRFAILQKKYDLVDSRGRVFATISSPIWKIWRFPILNTRGQTVGEISKKWKGVIQESFTDADSFLVDFGKPKWDLSQKAVILGAAISIDFDFFETTNNDRAFLNQSSIKPLDVFDEKIFIVTCFSYFSFSIFKFCE